MFRRCLSNVWQTLFGLASADAIEETNHELFFLIVTLARVVFEWLLTSPFALAFAHLSSPPPPAYPTFGVPLLKRNPA